MKGEIVKYRWILRSFLYQLGLARDVDLEFRQRKVWISYKVVPEKYLYQP